MIAPNKLCLVATLKLHKFITITSVNAQIRALVNWSLEPFAKRNTHCYIDN